MRDWRKWLAAIVAAIAAAYGYKQMPPTPTTTTTTTTSTSTSTTLAPVSTTTTLPATPTPSAGCVLPAMRECGHDESEPGHFGCCWTDKFRPLPDAGPFPAIVDQEQDAIERDRSNLFDRDGRADEAAYVGELVRRLRARGLCATRGGPGDEVGLKASNGESFQFDVHLGNGRPRRGGYTAYCRPARF